MNAVAEELRTLFYLPLREEKERALAPKQSRPFSDQS